MTLLEQAKDIIIVQESARLFFAHSINGVTIKDIAQAVGVGEATVYRRYKTKYNLVLAVANYFQKKIVGDYFQIDPSENGLKRLERFYGAFLKIFQEQPNYFKFIKEFDAFVINSDDDEMDQYGEGILHFRDLFLEAYEAGLKDKTVRPILEVENFYFATTHALMELCKKLAGDNIIPQDRALDRSGEIKVLIETILYRLK